jgi:hypothetical protein
VFYPLSGAFLSFVIYDPLFSLQLISFFSFFFSIFFIQKILRLIELESKEESDYFLLTAFSLSPFMLLYSSVVMTDLLSIFFITGSVYFFLQYSVGSKQYYFYFFIFFTSSAFMTRYASAVVLIIPVIIIIIKLFIPLKQAKLSLILYAAAITLVCLIPHFYLKSNASSALDDLQIRHWDLVNFLRSSFSTNEGFSSSVVPNIVFVFSNLVHPYYIFFGIVLLFFLRKADWKLSAVRLSVLILLLFAFFMAGFPFQNKRHLLLSFPFVIILLHRPFNRVLNLLRTNRLLKIALILILIFTQTAIHYYAFGKIYELNRIEKKISATLLKYDNPVLYTFFIDPALKSYEVNKKIINMWGEKINLFQKEGLVLFNEVKFKEQWKNKNPMINWNYLKKNYQLIKLQSFDDGWELYEIK